MGLKRWLLNLMPYGAMVMVESLDVGMTTIAKAAMSKGMSHFVFVVYSNALASLILLLPSFFFPTSPPLTFSLVCNFFLPSLIGYWIESYLASFNSIEVIIVVVFVLKGNVWLLIFIYFGGFFYGITVMQNCVFTGVDYSSPTLASAMSNLIPAFTFLIALIFRFYLPFPFLLGF